MEEPDRPAGQPRPRHPPRPPRPKSPRNDQRRWIRAQATSLWWALALGSDLGGNATAVGASANVVIVGIAARNGHPISFWHFTKYGLAVTAVTVSIAWGYFALRYVVLA